ncbi:MAG: MipA/OmpV family protein [Acidobacteriota bacterium]
MSQRSSTSARSFAAALLFSFGFVFLGLAPPAAVAAAAGDGRVTVGAAVLPEFEGSDDNQVVPLISLRRGVGDFVLEVEGLGARLDLVGEGSIWRAGPAIRLALPREDDVDAAAVAALPEVDFALEVGAFVGFEMPFTRAQGGQLSGTLTLTQDVLDAHEGFVVQANLEYFFAVNRMLRVGLGPTATYASGDYMRSYFSVDAAGSAASGLPVFDADAGLKDAGFQAFTILSFSEQWGVLTRVAYTKLLGDAADSPIVEIAGDDDHFFVGMGAFYRF